MTDPDHLVIALDDDPAFLSSLDRLLTASGHPVRCHTDPGGFFAAGRPAVPACLLLDYELADGANGTDVHAEIQRRGWNLPTVKVHRGHAMRKLRAGNAAELGRIATKTGIVQPD